MAKLLLWFVLAFLCGSLPFSVWIGRSLLKREISDYGDANPGATNVRRAGGKFTWVLALLLDFAKGALPVWLAYRWAGLQGGALISVALAPVLGHAFSPFLGFKGGKAVAVTGGIWCGLTLWEGPTVAGLLLGLFVGLLTVDAWAVILAMTGTIFYFMLTPPLWNGLDLRPDRAILLAVGIGNLLILAWKHRSDLTKPVAFRSRAKSS
ncbi:MAG: glycerol-3-phosphate acyltransferase [Chloroflexi bacterium]|nr:glycerol-3-phosphate acyltransferase [Chloroflexota bacterium]